MRSFIYSLFACVLIALIGCQSTDTPAHPHPSNDTPPTLAASGSAATGAVPPWLQTPPRDTAEFLYGSAVADDRGQARRAALLDIAERLSVTLQSEFEQRIEERSGDVTALNEVARLRTVQTVGAVHFNAFEEADSQMLRNAKVAVLVRVARQRMLQETGTRIETLAHLLARATPDAGLSGYPNLQRAGQMRTQASELRRLVNLYHALGGNPAAYGETLRLASRAEDHFANVWKGTEVLVQASGFSTDLAESIRSHLAAAGVVARLQASYIGPDVLVIQLRGSNRVQPLANGFQATVSQFVTVRQGNDVFFRGDWQASAMGDSRQSAVDLAGRELLNQLLELDGLHFLGW